MIDKHIECTSIEEVIERMEYLTDEYAHAEWFEDILIDLINIAAK